MGTKIIHVSDTHIGKQQYGSKIRERDYSKAFDTVVDIAVSKNVDAVIHTGDLFDSRTPSTGSVNRTFKSISRLSESDIKFLGIVGNHERKWDDQWLEIFENLRNVHHLDQSPYIVNNEIAIYGFDSIRESSWENMDFNLEETDEDLPVCVCMHELFTEIVPPTKADRSLKHVIDNMNLKPDIFALGDYHSAEDIDVEGIPSFYAGATERTSATTTNPTIRVIEVDNKEVKSYSWMSIEGVNDDVPRPFYSIDVNLDKSTRRLDVRTKVQENVADSSIDKAVVVVNLKGSNESPVTAAEVYEVLESLGTKVPYVSDKREPEVMDLESKDISDPTSIDIDDMIEDQIEEEVTDDVKDLDETVVRDLTVNKSDIRDIVNEKFEITGDKNEN